MKEISFDNQEQIKYFNIQPTFLMATAFERLAKNQDKLPKLLANSNWLDLVVQKVRNIDQESNIFSVYSDVSQYPDSPSPEKQPINKMYFKHHKSLVFDLLAYPTESTHELIILSISLRLFESGAIGLRCLMGSRNENKQYNINSAVSMLRKNRLLAKKSMVETFRKFIIYWNKVNIEYQLNEISPECENNQHIFEDYEFINFDMSDNNNKINDVPYLISNKNTICKLNQLVGFCRMAKPYAWPNYSLTTLRSFISENIGTRKDELWLAYTQRFIRYYPNKDIPETNSYANDILLTMEILLGLKSVYKYLIEDIRKKFANLPSELNLLGNSLNSQKEYPEIEKLQEEMVNTTYKLSRGHFSSIVRFYAGTGFVDRVLSKIEEVMQLPQLSKSLLSEMDKLKKSIDSFETIIAHRQNMSLQRSIFWLTIIIGALGIIIALAQIVK